MPPPRDKVPYTHNRYRRDIMMFATRRDEMMRETRYQNLWELIVNNDDICFKHILPRLNQTDLNSFTE